MTCDIKHGFIEICKIEQINRDNMMSYMEMNKLFCEYCIEGKITRNIFLKMKRVGEL